MVNVYFTKNVDRRKFVNLDKKIEKLEDYIIKFCGSQYSKKVDYFLNDCDYYIINRDSPLKMKVFLNETPKSIDSSPLFNMPVLADSAATVNKYWEVQRQQIYQDLNNVNGSAIRNAQNNLTNNDVNFNVYIKMSKFIENNYDMIKKISDNFYTILFQDIKNNTRYQTPASLYRNSFESALTPIFKKIVSNAVDTTNWRTDAIAQSLLNICINQRFSDYDIQKSVSFLYYELTHRDIPFEQIPQEYFKLVDFLYYIGNFFVNQTKTIIQSSFNDGCSLDFLKECKLILPKIQSEAALTQLNDFYNQTNSTGRTISNFNCKPFCLLAEEGIDNKTIVHETIHGISFNGILDPAGNGTALNEILTDFIARGVVRLMRQDNFSLVQTDYKSNSSYALPVQYMKEFTMENKDILIKAYFENSRKLLFDEFGKENIFELHKIIGDLIHGTGYYEEDIQNKFEDVFDKIALYKQDKINQDTSSL